MDSDESTTTGLTAAADQFTWSSARQSAGRMGMTSARVVGASWSFLIRSSGLLIAFGVQTLLARTIGPDGFGRYVYVMAWMNVVLQFAMLEFETSGIRFVGSYVGTQRWGMLRGFLRETQMLVLAVSVGLSAVGATAVILLHDRMNPLLYSAGLWTCLLLAPTALLTVQAGYLQGFQRMVWAQAPQQMLRPLLFGAAMLCFIAINHKALSAWHAVVGNLIATVVTLAVSTFLLRRATPDEVAMATAESEFRLWVYTARGMMVIAVAQMVLGPQMDVVIVGSMIGASASALYGTASQIAILVSFAASAITLVAIPEVAQLYAQRRMPELQRLLHLMLVGTTAVTVPAVCVVLLLGHYLLGLFGSAFHEAYPILVIMSINQAVVGIVGIMAGYVLTMTGHERDAAIIIGVSAIANLVLAVIFTKIEAIELVGAALATLLATAGRSVALAVFARRRLGLDLVPMGWFSVRRAVDR